ncbi:MAG: hypothetical protein IPL65_14310 [Lewinellaceae bacterium]|nr:hypothetical protein [Lewinellaceae bacterium]
MIDYEENTSPFFQANKAYCMSLEKRLSTLPMALSGYCNSYGFDIEGSTERSGLGIRFRFEKFQRTQNGLVIPVNSTEYAGLVLRITGLPKSPTLTIGKNAFWRLLTPKMLRRKFPKPFYLRQNVAVQDDEISLWVQLLAQHNIASLKLQNGSLSCTIHETTSDPLKLLTDLEHLPRFIKAG